VDHGGSWGGYRAQLLRFPEQYFSVVCLCNVANANPEKRAHQVADVFLATEMKEPKPTAESDGSSHDKKETIPLSADQLNAYGGNFRSEELLTTYTLGVAGVKLMLQNVQNGDGFLHSSQQLTLRPVGQNTFVADDEGLEFIFERDSKGNVSGFQLNAGRTKGLAFHRK